jgi:hypothetical protein
MGKSRKQQFWQGLSCVVSLALVCRQMDELAGTEFSGGRITGPLLDMLDIGTLLLLLGLILTLIFVRVAAAIVIVACLLCLPLYLYFLAPGPFRQLFRGEYSVPLQSSFVCDRSLIFGILALTITICVCFHSFFANRQQITMPS